MYRRIAVTRSNPVPDTILSQPVRGGKVTLARAQVQNRFHHFPWRIPARQGKNDIGGGSTDREDIISPPGLLRVDTAPVWENPI